MVLLTLYRIFINFFECVITAYLHNMMKNEDAGIFLVYYSLKVAVNTIVPRSPFFLFLYLKTQTVTHIRKNAVEYLRQWNGAICVIYNLCQRQNIR